MRHPRHVPAQGMGLTRTIVRRLTMTILLLAGCGGAEAIDLPPPGALQLELVPVVTGLSAPVQLTAPAGDARMFIVEQAGRIRVVKDGQLLATPFLDITSRVSAGGERGLLSVAFDPAYATNGRFFVYYTNRDGDITIERFTVSA